jgi:hypothetical protein
MHPITILQGALVAAWLADPALLAQLGPDGVVDAPPKGRAPPFIVVLRHDLLARDGDAAPGFEHRLRLHIWWGEPSRRAVLALAERTVVVALGAPLESPGLLVTHRAHQRTDSTIDTKTGQARAAITLRFLTEPTG